MRVLLIYPDSPHNVGRTHTSIRLAGKKAYLPPLGLITVAALMPRQWEFKLVDCSFDTVCEDDWNRADLVVISGTIVQSAGILRAVREAKERRKIVAVGGPGVYHFPEEALRAGADFVVVGEGEVTVPLLLEALERKDYGIIIEDKSLADLSTSPVPRYDLLDMDAYVDLAIQYSRGCPFKCEFCDVTVMFGRGVRTKPPARVLAELETLYAMGWRRQIHFVDDNFVGNPVKAKGMLAELIPWMRSRGWPFQFYTYCSVLLGCFPDILDLMPRAGFTMVMLGIETTEKETLKGAGKHQNAAVDLQEACRKINRAGLEIMALTMIGFDNETRGADRRIIEFARGNSIPEVVVSFVQAFPGTDLYRRLEQEGRLLEHRTGKLGDWHSLEMNFVPTRPQGEIVEEFVHAHQVLYEPGDYLERAYAHFAQMDNPSEKMPLKKPDLYELRALLTTIVRQGLVRPSRWSFWKVFFKAATTLSRDRFTLFVRACIKMEHYVERKDKLTGALRQRTLRQVGQPG